MQFIVGGYDENQAYGKLFIFAVPTAPDPIEVKKDDFGIQWGGQSEIMSRVLNGYDPAMLSLIQSKVPNADMDVMKSENWPRIGREHSLPIFTSSRLC